ncbi:MAG TPA: hypothetical protein VNN10_12725 [Dehalococcoidia bacterium]|nr:hypothetical protein [Dehalococcoidia bacterium]
MENRALVLDLLGWLAVEPRPYAAVMRAWRTSCPRLPVWEDALDLGFVHRQPDAGGRVVVSLTDAGRGFLEAARPDESSASAGRPAAPAPDRP